MKAVPGHGEGVNRQVDGRGKSEQTRKELLPVYAGLPLSPRKLGTSLRVRGNLTLRKKEIIVLKYIT